MQKQDRYMKMAIEQAEDSIEFGGARVYSILVINNKIIAQSPNMSKKHPIAQKFTDNKEAIYPHSEVMTLFLAAKRLSFSDFSKSTLYVARVKQTHKGSCFVQGLVKPCVACRKCIESFGIKNVIYTRNNDFGIWDRGTKW